MNGGKLLPKYRIEVAVLGRATARRCKFCSGRRMCKLSNALLGVEQYLRSLSYSLHMGDASQPMGNAWTEEQ